MSASGDEEKMEKEKILRRLQTVVNDYGSAGTTGVIFFCENPKIHSAGNSNIQNKLREGFNKKKH